MVAQPANPAPGATGSSPASAHDTVAMQPKLPFLTSSPPSPPLPPLPAHDRPLLVRLLALQENYSALAAELSTDQWNHLGENRPKDLLDLYAWADQPHIAAWLARHRELTDLQRRTTALTALETVLKAAPAPTERRRAASTILRALDGRWNQWNRSRERSSHSPHAASRLPYAAPPPLPLSTPTPKSDPQSSITDLRAALACPVPAVALSTLHAHSAKNAFIAGQPVHEARSEWIATFPAKVFKGFEFPLITTQAGEILRNESTSRWDLWLRNRANDLFRCTLTLIRDNPADYPNPSWRIANLEVIPHNSG